MELIWYRTAFSKPRRFQRREWWVFAKTREELDAIEGREPRGTPQVGEEFSPDEF